MFNTQFIVLYNFFTDCSLKMLLEKNVPRHKFSRKEPPRPPEKGHIMLHHGMLCPMLFLLNSIAYLFMLWFFIYLCMNATSRQFDQNLNSNIHNYFAKVNSIINAI